MASYNDRASDALSREIYDAFDIYESVATPTFIPAPVSTPTPIPISTPVSISTPTPTPIPISTPTPQLENKDDNTIKSTTNTEFDLDEFCKLYYDQDSRQMRDKFNHYINKLYTDTRLIFYRKTKDTDIEKYRIKELFKSVSFENLYSKKAYRRKLVFLSIAYFYNIFPRIDGYTPFDIGYDIFSDYQINYNIYHDRLNYGIDLSEWFIQFIIKSMTDHVRMPDVFNLWYRDNNLFDLKSVLIQLPYYSGVIPYIDIGNGYGIYHRICNKCDDDMLTALVKYDRRFLDYITYDTKSRIIKRCEIGRVTKPAIRQSSTD